MPTESNNFCKPVTHKVNDCEAGRQAGQSIASIYKSAILRGVASLQDAKRSTECLIESVEVERIPIKLFCIYRAVVEELEKLESHLSNIGIKSASSQILNSANKQKVKSLLEKEQSNSERVKADSGLAEGTPTESQSNLPIFPQDDSDTKPQQEFDTKTEQNPEDESNLNV